MNAQTPIIADIELDAPSRSRKRRLGFLLLAAAIAIGILAYAAMRLLAPPSETTDDAYVGGNLVQITAQIAGTVVSIHADETDYVKSGHPLVRLDKADAQLMVAQAEAQLAKTVREVRNLRETSTGGEANVAISVALVRC